LKATQLYTSVKFKTSAPDFLGEKKGDELAAKPLGKKKREDNPLK